MIRRDAIEPNDGSPRWVLIPQTEHARLAAELVGAWHAPSITHHPARQEVLAAIAHHDDGWTAWEASPKVDPGTGQPIAFDEMPLAESLAIWRRSIDGCRALGNLAPWMVAGHFRARLRESTTADTELADAWHREFEPLQSAWLDAWLAESPERHDAAAAQTALAYLQLFDAMSLWFCCAVRTEVHRWTAPDGQGVSTIPLDSQQVVFQPWPFAADTLELTAAGASIPAARYPDPAALAAAPRTRVTLRWHLRRQA